MAVVVVVVVLVLLCDGGSSSRLYSQESLLSGQLTDNPSLDQEQFNCF